MGLSLNDISLTSSWSDLTATHGTLASTAARVFNVGNGAVAIVEGGGAAPTNKSGSILRPGDSLEVNNANVWAKALDSGGKVSVNLT